MKIGPIEWMLADGAYRPSLWMACPHGWLAVFFGWQKPSVLWVPR